jgi:hypothetical protein
MPRCGATYDENVGGALRAANLLADKTFRVAAGTAPPTFSRLFSGEFQHCRGRGVMQEKECRLRRAIRRTTSEECLSFRSQCLQKANAPYPEIKEDPLQDSEGNRKNISLI